MITTNMPFVFVSFVAGAGAVYGFFHGHIVPSLL